VAAAALLTACSGGSLGVSVPSPPSTEAAASCTALHAALPAELDAQSSRTTTPESVLTAAWGRPAITLRCGVATPTALTPTSQLLRVNGVDWLPEQLTAGYRFTTVGRVANVQVDVPDDYAPEADALTSLADPLKLAVPRAASR
jgi:hypothetical protein